jgi:hypothetical protein
MPALPGRSFRFCGNGITGYLEQLERASLAANGRCLNWSFCFDHDCSTASAQNYGKRGLCHPVLLNAQTNVVATFCSPCKIALRRLKELPAGDIQTPICRKVKPLSYKSEDDDEAFDHRVLVWRQYCDGVVGCVY